MELRFSSLRRLWRLTHLDRIMMGDNASLGPKGLLNMGRPFGKNALHAFLPDGLHLLHQIPL